MTPEEIRQTLEGHMATWTDVPVAFDGHPATPAVKSAQDNNTPWVRFTIAPGTTVNRSITDKPCPRRPGLVLIQIFTEPIGRTRRWTASVRSGRWKPASSASGLIPTITSST